MNFKVSHFLKKLSHVSSASGMKDNLRDVVEDGLARILCEGWSWNWVQRSYSLPAAVSEASGTWTYVQGDDYIELDAPLATLNFTHTGRKVQIGTQWYRCVDVGLRNTARVYLDRIIEEDGESDATALIFYRDDLCVRTTKIRHIVTDKCPNVVRFSPEFFKSKFSWSDPDQGYPAEPCCYIDDEPYKIQPPVFPLAVSASGTAGSFTAGTYYYFATRYDRESGLESAPGPVTEYNATSTNWPLVVYGNPSIVDQAEEGTSYSIRVYRSARNPVRENCPMYLVIDRTPAPASLPNTQDRISETARLARARYWSGNQCLVRFLPVPDDAIRRVSVDSVQSFGFKLDDDDSIYTGLRSEVTELLEVYVYTRMKYTIGEGADGISSARRFNQQLQYLLGQDQHPGQSDEGPENHRPLYAGQPSDPNWPESLSWSGTGWQVSDP